MQHDVANRNGQELKKIVDIEEQMCYNTMNRLYWIIMRIGHFDYDIYLWRCYDGEKTEKRAIPCCSCLGLDR